MCAYTYEKSHWFHIPPKMSYVRSLARSEPKQPILVLTPPLMALCGTAALETIINTNQIGITRLDKN